MLVVRPEVKTARQVVAAVHQLPDADLLEYLFGELLESPELSDSAAGPSTVTPRPTRTLSDQLEHWKGHAVMPETLA